MLGIDLDSPIIFNHASLRFFKENEHHVDRITPHDILPFDVLLLVFDGVLRFTESDIPYEIGPNQYHIQRARTVQTGERVSDAPQYLYVHFNAKWADTPYSLSSDGSFNYSYLKAKMEKLDKIAHSDFSYIEKCCLFYEILCSLSYNNLNYNNTAYNIRNYLNDNFLTNLSLDDLCANFNYSKNHIINIFKSKYGMTPIEYINDLKIKKAMHMLESTPQSLDSIALECGFNNYSHFYRLFFRKTGFSPTDWRKKIDHKPSILYDLYSSDTFK